MWKDPLACQSDPLHTELARLVYQWNGLSYLPDSDTTISAGRSHVYF